MKTCKLLSVVVAVASTLFVVLSARAEFTCELSFPSAPATPLENFPVLVRLADDAPTGFSYTDCPTGDCIWFTDADNNSLPYDVDTWNTSGASLIWVSVPSLSDATTITMHWDESHEEISRATEVWSLANYVGVWHMNEILLDSSSNKHYTPDSSASGWHADKQMEDDAVPTPVTTAAGVTTTPTPLTGTAMNIAYGAGKTKDSYGGFRVPTAKTSSTTLNGPGFTISAIVNAQQDSNSNRGRAVAFGDSWGDRANLTVFSNNIFCMGNNAHHNKTNPKGATDWVCAAAVYGVNGKSFIYADGANLSGAGGKPENYSSVALGAGIGLGAFTGGKETLDGYLDEVRIRNAPSTGEWVTNEYATVTDANYVSFGQVQGTGGGSSTLEFGTAAVSGITATGATISARLKGLGDGATSANLWLVISGFGQTRTYPLDPATETRIVEATATGLQPGAEWTAYLTATNNATSAVGANSAMVSFSTLSDAGAGSPGLYQAIATSQATAQDAAANWDISASGVITLGPLAMRSSGNNHVVWTSVDETSFQWGDNKGFGYAGYMYMEGGKDYYFGGAIDDAGYVWVDNGDANWNAKPNNTQLGSYGNWNKAGPYAIAQTGYYRVVFSCWNGSGGAGAEQAGNASLLPKLRYIALQSGASAPAMSDEGWQEAVDPGDGSLFLSEAPTRAVSVLSAVRDGTLLSARVAVGEAFPGEASDLRYVYGATNGGSDPADWEGGALVASSLPATAVTNDYLVAIAADTRFVRFYTQDGDAVTWSATVSLDWAGETTIAEAFIFLGDPDGSSAAADIATLSAVLNAPGADATSAQAWFILSGGGVTRTIPAGTATGLTNLTVAVTGLTPETAYTFYATATNNAATPVGVDSTTGSFTTGAAASEWNTARATFTQDGKSLVATIPVTSLGVGTTTIYLMTGNNASSENTASASKVVTELGEQTLTSDFSGSPWATKIYCSLMLVNGTAENAITNWPNVNVAGSNVFYNLSKELQDNSTYTWVGGSVGVWNDTANWELTAAGSLAQMHPAGYPVFGSTAIFATAQGDDPITVTIPAPQGTTKQGNNPLCWWVSNLNLDGMHEELIFTSEDIAAATSRFFVYNALGSQTYNRLTFDGCNVWMNTTGDLGASAADANGENFVLRFTGGTTAAFNQINVKSKPGFKFLVEDSATATASGGIYGGSNSGTYPCVLEIDNTAVTTSNKIEPDNANSINGMVFRLKGTNATLTGQYFQPKYATSTNVIEFVVPVGGYNAVPVQTTHGTYLFGSGGNSGTAAPMTLRVSKDSPGLSSVSRSRGIQLLYSKGGVNAENLRFEDVRPNYNGFFFKDAEGNEYADAAAIETAGKTAAQITQIWYRHPASGFMLYVR